MKKILLIVLLFATYLSLNAQGEVQLLQKAEDFYKNQSYDSAVFVYKSILDNGYVDAQLYYNLGNSYFKNQDIAHAILYYEKALLLSPYDKDIQFNLKFANSKQVDTIEVLPEGFIARLFKSLYRLASVNMWSIISALMFVFALILLFVFLFNKQIFVKKIAFYGAIILVFGSVLSVICAKNRNRELTAQEYAIIMEPSVTIKAEPAQNAKELAVIHSGTKVRIVGVSNVWTNIRLSNNKEGWILSEYIEGI